MSSTEHEHKPVITESCESISPSRLEQARSAFELSVRGFTQEKIGERLGISRSKVIRLLNDYNDLYSKRLDSESRLHLLSEELARLDEIERTAREDAESCNDNREKQGFLKLALQAAKTRQELLLATGVIPKEPSKLVAVSCSGDRPTVADSESSRTDAQIKADVLALLKHGLTI